MKMDDSETVSCTCRSDWKKGTNLQIWGFRWETPRVLQQRSMPSCIQKRADPCNTPIFAPGSLRDRGVHDPQRLRTVGGRDGVGVGCDQLARRDLDQVAAETIAQAGAGAGEI